MGQINKINKNFSQLGQSLVESLVALGISIVIISGLVAAVNISLKNTRINRIRSNANKVSKSALEFIRSRRDSLLWSQFLASYPPSGSTNINCFNGITLTPKTLPDCPEFTLSGTTDEYRCEVVISYLNGPNYNGADIKVTVSWTEDGSNWNKKTISQTTLTDWK